MSIRFRLTIAAIAVILVANSLLSFIALQYLGHTWMGEVQNRVRRNLNSARAAYQSQTDVIAWFLRATARDCTLAPAAARNDRATLETMLRSLGESNNMDFVGLTDAEGRVICRSGSRRQGDDISADPLVAQVLRDRTAASGTVVFSQKRLLAEGRSLADRAAIPIIPTEAARPPSDLVLSDGLVIAAAVPLLDDRGQIQAILYGGHLLNQRYEIVDAIKDQVFRGEAYQGREIGTVTIFLRDVRVSTNVKRQDGSRAVGTQLSTLVSDAVLERGEIWAAPAFVVNDWYITAYEPIRDPAGKIIGVLYVGLLRAPFTHQLRIISVVFLTIIGGATLASLVLLLLVHGRVLRPVHCVVDMAQKVIGGDLTARVGIRPPGEMGVLCRAVDSMAEAVAERAELLKQATRQQIHRSEQLASVGRLAAGVAHEINNPLTGVLAFADLMREKENLDDQDREDLDVIIRETKRVREIVRGLLDYARETPSVKKVLNVNDVIRQMTRLLGNREAFQHVNIVEILDDNLPPINGDQNQLQQVLLNLALNACEAMTEGGTLVIATSLADHRVVIEVTDTGCGIAPEHLDKIFDPFFTTKPVGKGTGLGLSVSSAIVQQHDGTLEVRSSPGKGTTFSIALPVVQPTAA
ncbi:MAG: cache domain-containing protein [Pirellulales bacterium]|nr:cache domain-containing protein [Pirellulales bacterium]